MKKEDALEQGPKIEHKSEDFLIDSIEYHADWIDNSIGLLIFAMGICLGIVIAVRFL